MGDFVRGADLSTVPPEACTAGDLAHRWKRANTPRLAILGPAWFRPTLRSPANT